jgi:hypothetical protein
LRRLHLDGIVRREQHFALKLSFVEMEKQISAHVGNVAVDLSRRTDGATIRTLLVKRNPLHFRLHVKSLAVRLGKVRSVLRVLDGERGAIHSQRSKHAFTDGIFPALAMQLSRNVTGRHEHQIVVLESAAQGLVGLEKLQTLDQIFTGKI